MASKAITATVFLGGVEFANPAYFDDGVSCVDVVGSVEPVYVADVADIVDVEAVCEALEVEQACTGPE